MKGDETMYNNPYTPYSPQLTADRIDNQIAQLQQLKTQIPTTTQPAINQTFQLSSGSNAIRYANSLEDVNKELVIGDTPFFSRDMSIVWIKDIHGQVKTYELNEVVIKDEKDLMIESLQMQINEMKGMINNAKSNSTNDVEQYTKPIESKKPTNVSNVSTSSKKSK